MSNSEEFMSDKPQFWILRGTGIVFAVIIGACSWAMSGMPLAIKKVLDDFGTDLPLLLWFLYRAGAWLLIVEVLALLVAVFLFANPKSSARNLMVGWCLLTGVAILLPVVVIASFTAPGLLRIIEDVS
jgi:lipopolysaccharide export LptBFGC system permease protein LptF